MNEQSSRSHFVFTLRISGVNEVSTLVFHNSSLNRCFNSLFLHMEYFCNLCYLLYPFINQSTEQQVQGVLNLIDLAGSERLSKSGSTGDRLKETQVYHQTLFV